VVGVLFGLALYNKAQAKEYYYYEEKWQKKNLQLQEELTLPYLKRENYGL